MSTHRSRAVAVTLSVLAATATGVHGLTDGACTASAQERSRPQKNLGQQQREDSLKADKARKSGEMGTQPATSPETSAAPGLNATNPVQGIQTALKAHGHDPGPIDGVMGRRTQDALRAYQTAQHLKVTGRIDDATLDRLGIRPAARNP